MNKNNDDVPMPLTSHLGELRKRLVNTLVFIISIFVITTAIEMELEQPILSAFRAPLDDRNVPLVFLELTEPFFTYLRIGLYSSIFLSFPYLVSCCYFCKNINVSSINSDKT